MVRSTIALGIVSTILLVMTGGVGTSSVARAQPAAGDEGVSWHEKTAIDFEPATESWIGFEGFQRVASIYSGATWSPFANLRQDGFRLRVIGGESFYKYSGSRYDPAANDSVLKQFSGTARFVTALAGWQFSGGGTTAKVFGGYEYANHAIVPFDPETKIQGAAGGLKGVAEIWHNWTPHTWTSLDLAVSGAHRSYSAQVRFGQRFGEGWSLGPEGSVIGHTETTLQRLGAFVRFENLVHEFTVSGGATRARGDQPSGYATAQYLRRF